MVKKNSKDMKYRQCKLVRTESTKVGNKTATATYSTVSWIPEKHAKLHRILELQDDNGDWTDGWVVESAGELCEKPADWHKMIKGHRKATGDNLPKRSGQKS